MGIDWAILPRHRSRPAVEKRDVPSVAASTCHEATQQSIEIREAYLVKRRSSGSRVSSFSFQVSCCQETPSENLNPET